tara:strand:+ start:775 stop:1926 length:1152 start_codon:yes stop_codon:yes gene_type:complete
MATTFKNFLSNDLANTRTLLHEAIPITGSIVSGTYGGSSVALGSETNLKTYGHGMFESVYDYPYLSSSANQIFDVTVGYASTSPVSGATNSQNSKKINIYNQMAQYLVGYDVTGSIKKFTMPTNSATMKECYFIPFSRLLTKDEIKKGSFTLELSVSGCVDFIQAGTSSYFGDRIKLADTSGSNGYYVDSPAGEYGVLFASTSVGQLSFIAGESLGTTATNPAAGLLYYQAGIAVVSASVFNEVPSGGLLHATNFINNPRVANVGDNSTLGFTLAATGATIAQMGDGLRNRIYNISYNNTTELNSTIYFCRIGHGDFNYSSNPTYLTGSQIRVKTRAADTPVTYFTTVGLYSADNELLAVAKLSEPLRKDPTNEITLRVRLDY